MVPKSVIYETCLTVSNPVFLTNEGAGLVSIVGLRGIIACKRESTGKRQGHTETHHCLPLLTVSAVRALSYELPAAAKESFHK